MRMEVRAAYKPRYWLVPSVNYNGNGWGSGAQYSGWADQDGTPWTYAWHRVAVPACTYSEDERFAVSLFGEEKGGMSCTIYPDGEETVQALLWPEQEGPRVLFKRFWKGPYKGTMEPRTPLRRCCSPLLPLKNANGIMTCWTLRFVISTARLGWRKARKKSFVWIRCGSAAFGISNLTA